MSAKEFTTEQLADRWMDQREIQNMMAKFVYCKLFAEHNQLVDRFFASEDDITLGVNEGYYVGREAIKAYYRAIWNNAEQRAALMKELFPKFLGKYSDEELHGVGSVNVDALTTCVIELSGDGKTAKGLWYVLGQDNDIYEYGPYSMVTHGYMAADFIREGDDWKIWHLQDVEDIKCPTGTDWSTDPGMPEILPQFSRLANLSLPEPTVKQVIREHYSSTREFTPLAKVPEPYYTFADTFSYGI